MAGSLMEGSLEFQVCSCFFFCFLCFLVGDIFQGAVETEMTLTPPLEPAAARASSSAMPLTPPLEDVLMSSPQSQAALEDPYQICD